MQIRPFARRCNPFVRLALLTLAAIACHNGPPPPSADSIVEGRAPNVVPDTIADLPSVLLEQGRPPVRVRIVESRTFWDAISVLDLAGAERTATSVDQRTFTLALKSLMTSEPEDAAIAFRGLHLNSGDPGVRARARIGLTMALSWNSDWKSLATIGGVERDTLNADALEQQAAVERWAHAFESLPPLSISIPANGLTLPLRRSAFGTPLVTVSINGKPHEFWLDTGASMTLVSGRVAQDANVKLASSDTLALGVVAGHIPARAVYIDSLGIGGIAVRGVSAALVNPSVLRLDRREVSGVMQSIPIDGVIGTDLLRAFDLVLDANAGTITIRRPVRNQYATRNLYWVGYPVVRLVTRDGHLALFGLDTGAEATYLTTSLLRKEPNTPVAVRRGSIGGLGEAQHRTEWVARALTLIDGENDMLLRNIPVAPERRWTFVNFDGVIGSDVALHARLHLDFVNGIFDIRAPQSGAGPSVKVEH